MKKLIAILLICTTCLNAQTICDSVSLSIVPSSTLTVTGNNSSTSSFTFIWGVCDSIACYSSSDDTAYFSQEWVLHSTVSIHEIIGDRNNSKIYNLLGVELKHAPINRVYIKNGVKYLFTL